MDTLRIYIVTWNVATRAPEADFSDLLNIKQFKNDNALPDFYIVGLQEVKSQPQNFILDALFNDPWTNALKTTLTSHDYVKVKSSRLVGLLLNVFCLRKHIVHLRDISTQQTRTGLKGFWGNKGAVTIRLQIYGCSICLINCHLAPHDNFVKERIEDYNAILQGQKFAVKDTIAIFFHEYVLFLYVFWFGDLNFRLSNDTTLSSEEIIRRIQTGKIEELLERDQLKQVMRSGEAFSELNEDNPTFQPTYKYNVKSQNYDVKRRPAWTDRILYRVNKYAYESITLGIKQVCYQSVDKYSLSDHKPVVSELEMKVFSNHSERPVELSVVGSWKVGRENKFSVSFDANVEVSIWDWVGLYHDNFNDLDEYLCYVYVSPRDAESTSCASGTSTPSSSVSTNLVFETSECRKLTITFPDTAVQSVGHFRLLYFTRNSDSILGMSDVFYVEENSGPRESLDW